MAIVPINLGEAPKSFARVTKFKSIDGAEMQIPVIYKWRSREDYMEWVEKNAKARLEHPGLDDLTAKTKAQIQREASELLDMLESWGLDGRELNAANAGLLCNIYPQAVAAMYKEYQEACLFGRSGN